MGELGELAVVILAAGEGTRMRSKQPKVLHPVCGRPILAHAVATSRELGATRIVCVVGNGEAQVREAVADEPVEFVVQNERRGTAHAVLQARELLANHQGAVLVMYGDHPLFRAASFSALIDAYREQNADLALLVAEYPDRSDFGRIVRGPDGKLERIVEHHDASPEIRALREVNLGVYLIQSELLLRMLERIGNDNEKGEYYLTELVPLVLEDAGNVITSTVSDWDESLGVNSRVDLARAESVMRQRIAERWMLHGVTIESPDHTYIDADVEIGPDTVLAPGVCLRGTTRLGSGCRIDAGAVVENSTLGDGVWLKPHCHVEESELGNGCIAGPSAHFRPNCRLAEDVRVGNFVEVKNSTLGRGTKADHLSYIGDADVGEKVTFACGAITVNYDGRLKHRTTVGDGAFVGCNANLIAPIKIAARAYVAAGSTITQEVPSKALAVGRARQRNIDGWWDRKFGDDEQE
jgi:bifunctional UDP-N-acetylglucosamine pyrophosphorylase/glucosamine-1-phosphate N-acetyltransferase